MEPKKEMQDVEKELKELREQVRVLRERTTHYEPSGLAGATINQVAMSKSLYRILSSVTGENRADVALELAAKDLLRLKLKDVEQQIAGLTAKYNRSFAEFKQAWDLDQVPDRHTFEVERDYWEWEAAVEDAKKYQQFLDELL
jgi:hypothetical protein